MKLGVDASNLRGGGGVTHLSELLRGAKPLDHGFSQIIIWAATATLAQIENRPWLVKVPVPALEKSLPYRAFWQRFKLSSAARTASCSVLFVPGGSFAGDFQPVVAMSQNLLPFELRELRRFGWSLMSAKLCLLRWTQSRTYKRAGGVMFLTRYARDVVLRTVGGIDGKTTIVPHGVEMRFFRPPREQFPIGTYSPERPFRLLYVSIIQMYKHQWTVAEAVARLRDAGLPVSLEFVGPAYPPALRRLHATMHRLDPDGKYLRYSGAVAHSSLQECYARADAFVFASSCENMPNILVESMASGLPVACSNRGPMPEMLEDAGVYFDPENATDIARALRELIEVPARRKQMACASFATARQHSWQRCAHDTLAFLAQIARAS